MKMDIKQHDTLKDTVVAIPEILQKSLGSIHYPTDSSKLIQALNNNQLIGASDGSLVTEGRCTWGSHAYSIRTWDNDDAKLTGMATTPSTTKMSSLTTEIYGLLSATTVLYCITKHHQQEIQKNKCITIYCDNEQAVKMCNDTNHPINITETNVPEYDIKRLIQTIVQIIPATVHFQCPFSMD